MTHYVQGPLWQSFLHVVLGFACMCVVAGLGMFDSVKTEEGAHHYAESLSSWSGHWLALGMVMPLNTVVNLGYVILGCYIHRITSRRCKSLCARYQPKPRDPAGLEHQLQDFFWYFAYCSHLFGWMACIYGPVQLVRIITQQKLWSVLDQWCTLPFFMWVCAWTLLLMLFYGQMLPSPSDASPSELRSPSRPPPPTPSTPVESESDGITRRELFPMAALMCTSVFSYSLSLLSDIGFELSLMAHVLIAVLSAVVVLIEYSHRTMWLHFFGALLSCAGFVGLKLADHALPKLGGEALFTVLSGHFLSKLCDIGQIYFVTLFFFDALQRILAVVEKLR